MFLTIDCVGALAIAPVLGDPIIYLHVWIDSENLTEAKGKNVNWLDHKGQKGKKSSIECLKL